MEKRQTASLLEQLDLLPLANIHPMALSGGQKQRVAIAGVLAMQPEIIVLDEPTSFLDVRHKLELLDVLKTMVREKNVAVIVSLHELDLAEKLSDRVVCVAKGRIDRCGTPEEIFRDDYIPALYGIDTGSFNALFGSVELPAVSGKPQVFVIGGGGSGISAYRALQRAGVPFAAGILPESDLDHPVAKALAAEIYEIPAFAAADAQTAANAEARMCSIGRVVSTVSAFGETNAANERLYKAAKAAGLLVDLETVLEEVEP